MDDLDELVRLADNRAIWRNMRDQFPNPYTRDGGARWIETSSAEAPVTHFAIEADGQLVGGIGLTRKSDIYARTGEVGYWLGEPHWGRGLAAEALTAFAPWCMETFTLDRLHAAVFVWNPTSARVLEKAGFALESRVRNAAFKDGQVVDEWIYARFRDSRPLTPNPRPLLYFTPEHRIAISPSAAQRPVPSDARVGAVYS